MKNILICTDGSGYSHEACLYAAWLSQQTKADISVLYVTDIRQFEIPAVADFSGSLGIQPFEGMINQLQEVEKIKSDFVKEQALKVLKDAGVKDEKITFHNETGLLVEVISDYADVADLVLLGKRGEDANFASEHLGSMLERVLRSIDKPCLVTNRQFKPFDKVAIAYDGSPSCRLAIKYMANHEIFRALDLHLIVCVEGHKEDQTTERMKEAETAMNKSGLFPQSQVLTGEVETAIADYVKKSHVDLLVVGAYGHSRIRELLIGSTTTQLLRRCHVPVLCFR